MTQKAINYAEVLCELNIDAAELSDMEAVVRENPELQEALTCPVVSREKKSEVIDKIFDGSKTTVKFLRYFATILILISSLRYAGNTEFL